MFIVFFSLFSLVTGSTPSQRAARARAEGYRAIERYHAEKSRITRAFMGGQDVQPWVTVPQALERVMGEIAAAKALERVMGEIAAANAVITAAREEDSRTRGAQAASNSAAGGSTCAICLEGLDKDAFKLHCGHSFHLSCLKEW